MLAIDPDELGPCEEYFENPFGPHSPSLQRLLTLMRADTVDDPRVIVEAQDAGFGLGVVSELRGVPVRIYAGVHFDTYAHALRAMFKLRWELLTGQVLPLGKQIDLDDLPQQEVVDERILAYADRWDVRPGETVGFKVNTGELAPSYAFDVVRIRSAVGHPGGPGERLTPVATAADGAYEGRNQTTLFGSYVAFAERCPVELTGFSVRVNVKPTLGTGRPQSILGTWDAAHQTGFITVCPDLAQILRFGNKGWGRQATPNFRRTLPNLMQV